MSMSLRTWSCSVVAASFICFAAAGAAEAGRFEAIYTSNDQSVRSNLLAGVDGSLYGIAKNPYDEGPAPREASIFKLAPPKAGQLVWTYSTIYTFAGSVHEPTGMVMDRSGSIYCTTLYGGPFNGGTLFSLTPPAQPQGTWSQTVLYDRFGDPADGSSASNGEGPYGPFYIDGAGTIYGIVSSGVGVSGYGGIYRLMPPESGHGEGSYSIIGEFDPATGINAGLNGLFHAHDGSFFGIGATPGAIRSGSVWRLPPAAGQALRRIQVVDVFSESGSAGIEPSALVADRSLTLFGTNYSSVNGRLDNIGAVFRLRPPTLGQSNWHEDVLYKFSTVGFTDGRAPTALVESPQGVLYGTAQYRGNQTCSNGCGTIFRLTPRDYGGTLLPWNKQDAYQFNTPAAAYPTELIKGTLTGGAFAMFGIANKTIFEFVP